ncbi:MAG: hypothetical protein M0Z66_05450 [Thermaerobacter sp.]|nr:hypothetical protein [Thermaerobacter sp.]
MQIVVYRITGQQGWLRVPDWVCHECDLTIAAVRQACEQVGLCDDVLTIKPWLTHLHEVLPQGAHHPPVVLIDGKVYSQGVVPSAPDLTNFLRGVLAKERIPQGGIS